MMLLLGVVALLLAGAGAAAPDAQPGGFLLDDRLRRAPPCGGDGEAGPSLASASFSYTEEVYVEAADLAGNNTLFATLIINSGRQVTFVVSLLLGGASQPLAANISAPFACAALRASTQNSSFWLDDGRGGSASLEVASETQQVLSFAIPGLRGQLAFASRPDFPPLLLSVEGGGYSVSAAAASVSGWVAADDGGQRIAIADWVGYKDHDWAPPSASLRPLRRAAGKDWHWVATFNHSLFFAAVQNASFDWGVAMLYAPPLPPLRGLVKHMSFNMSYDEACRCPLAQIAGELDGASFSVELELQRVVPIDPAVIANYFQQAVTARFEVTYAGAERRALQLQSLALLDVFTDFCPNQARAAP